MSKKECAYIIGTLGSVQSAVNYTFDGTWGDLLIGYNGKTIKAKPLVIYCPTALKSTVGSISVS